MGAFIVRQPNGRLCRFSTVVDCPTHYQMTEDDYIELCAERAREEARSIIKHHIRPFEELREYFRNVNMDSDEFERIIGEMSEPYDGEMVET